MQVRMLTRRIRRFSPDPKIAATIALPIAPPTAPPSVPA
jgi:hypothetical protein